MVQSLLVADDLALVACNEDELQYSVHNLHMISAKYNMEINIEKTKVMTFHGQYLVASKICLLTYLLIAFKEPGGSLPPSHKPGIGPYPEQDLLKQINGKTNLDDSESESSSLNADTEMPSDPDEFDNSLKKITQPELNDLENDAPNYGVSLKEKIPNATLYQLADTQDITHAAITFKWKWDGHVARLPGDRWTYRATMWDPRIGRRLQGRPRRRWADFFREQAGQQWSREARDRRKWKLLERHLCIDQKF
ncbi:hypothetical protein ANN_23839 [Periplaneta americana]|uniref:Reverse transcriptase domain-containing protein n=1 Tax=Periplaneta americana TaxID=6978 RepID=A0ABQ8SNF9_PERAM|nr:hypothetical protein ANN_23839 [Periplaneta americana]